MKKTELNKAAEGGSSPLICSVPFADCDAEEISTLSACLHLIRGGQWREIEYETRDGKWRECNDEEGMWPDATNFRVKDGISPQNTKPMEG